MRLKNIAFMPSNYRELMAIYKSILFLHVLKGQQVQVPTDNITAAVYMNRFGGSSKVMCELMTTIFVITHELKINLTAKFLASDLNGRADRLSRLLSPYEWQLHPQVFRQLEAMWGPHSIDRFMSKATTQLRRYNSLFFDPQTEGINVMALSWKGENNCVNSPFWMLNRIVKKIRKEKVNVTLIAPWWPVQSWFQELCKLIMAVPFQLPNCERVMLRRAGVLEPLKKRRWKIYAWRVCGKPG